MTQIADRVREVSNSSSTGPMTLEGTVVGFRRFRDVIIDGASVPYVIENGAEWEVGYGTFTAPATLYRDTVKASSNSGNKVDFGYGQKAIWVDAIADFFNTTAAAVNSVNGYTGIVTLTKGDIGLGNVDNTSDANKPVSTATQTALNAKVDSSYLAAQTGAASGLATLDPGGKLTSSQIPAITVTSYLGSVANQAAMLALTGQEGDWCIRSDLSTTWIITGSDPSALANWTQLSYPTAPVTSINGYTGAVTLSKSDVGLGNVDNTTDANKPISTATQTALNGKQPTVTVNGVVKGDGAGGLTAATAGTDYAPATSGSAILKGNGAGGFTSATAGTDYQAPIGTISGLAKGDGANALTAATAGTDYVAPGGALGTPSSGNLSSCTADGTNAVGYLAIPQNAQTGNYTLVLADSGKHIYHASGAGAATYTIPANASVAFPVGTAVTFINLSSTSISIAITSDSLYLAGSGTTGTRTLAQYGSATALKVTSTGWIISGTGMS